MGAMQSRTWIGFSFPCLWLLLCLLTSPARAQKAVRQIEIVSGWGGLGTAQKATVTIRSENGVFLRGGKPVDSKLVDNLVAALAAPLIAKPELANLGITPEWLKTQIVPAEDRMQGAFPDALSTQKKLFEGSLTDPRFVAKVLPDLFNFTRFDDYPFVHVQVSFKDGSKVTANSRSYYAFQIPWKIGEDTNRATFNADLSRAVSSLMPPRTANKERLDGMDIGFELAEAVMTRIEPQWKMLGVEGRSGGALNALRAAYTVERADINSYHSAEYGKSWEEKGPHESNLDATLHKAGFPPNFRENAILLDDQGQVQGVEAFLKSASRYEQLALSVQWLVDALRSNPKVNAFLFYVHGQSFSDKAMRSFTLDMKARGREDLVEKVRAQQAEIALVKIDGADWLIFPDKHTILWRYSMPSGLLKWAPSEFPASRCPEYPENGGGCAGREVAADGTLAPAPGPRDEACVAAWRSLHPAISDNGPLFRADEGGKYGFIDRNGNVAIPFCFEAVGDFAEDLASFERDKRQGYMDKTGTVVIAPTFPWADPFSEGLARVQVTGEQLGYEGRWGFIDRKGKLVIAPVFKKMMDGDQEEGAFHDGLARFESETKSGLPRIGFIDRTGKVAIPARFSYIYPFSGGIASATEDESGSSGWGYVDTTGKWVISPQFGWASAFSEGLAAVNRKKDCGYIDGKGTLVLTPPVPLGEKDCATVWGGFSDGLSRWRFGKKYGYIDHSGKTIIEARFDNTSGFSEGLAAVLIDGKWGYIDTTGKMVIEPQPWQEAGEFHNGLARVWAAHREHGYIDKTGKYAWRSAPDVPVN